MIAASTLLVWACGSSDRSGFDEASINGDKSGGPKDPFSKSVDMPPDPQPCVGLECQQTRCEELGGIKTSTTIQGVVYDPAGKNPLYNVVVYVPNAPLQPLTKGATCDACDALYSGAPLVATTTNARGEFTLANMPAGDNIPLVVQVGKWRRQMVIPHVDKCMTQSLADKSVRLPKNHLEGDIPNIAISTGGADSLECLLRRVGIDASEYAGGPNGDNRIHIFRGGLGFLDGSPDTSPGAPHASDALWNTTEELKKYDVVLLSCEGAETANMNRPALFDYAKSGGRVFASHFHYAWLNDGAFGSSSLASWKSGTNDMGDIGANIVTSFPKGQALHDWLSHVNALDKGGELLIEQAKHNADVSPYHVNSTEWIVSNARAIPAHATQYFTFNTPIGAPAAQQCGRVVYSDLHVGAASYDYEMDRVVPNDCRSDVDLSPQEKALEFMLFDLSSCVSPDNKPPPEPPGKGPR